MAYPEHHRFLREAIHLADLSVANGNHPFGAVLVRNKRILERAQNTKNTTKDPTDHAEMNLVRLAVKRYSPKILSSCILYSSAEPCPMCTGAIYWSGIKSIVFGISQKRLSKITGGGGMNISSRDMTRKAYDKISILGPILETEAEEIHKSFWK